MWVHKGKILEEVPGQGEGPVCVCVYVFVCVCVQSTLCVYTLPYLQTGFCWLRYNQIGAQTWNIFYY